MTIKFPTANDITKTMVETLAGPGSQLDDLQNNWVMKTLILGVRDIAYEQVVAAKASYEANSLFSAVGADLDRLCVERSAQVRRKEATKARLQVRLIRNQAVAFDVQIPAGSLVTTQAIGSLPRLDYFTAASSAIAAGSKSSDVDVECSTVGVGGNLPSGAALLPGMAGVDAVEVLSLVNEGADRETDEALRERLLEDVQTQERGGAAADYELWAKRVTGVVNAKCLPLARGNGTVDVIITGTAGLPTQDLTDAVQAYIDQLKPGDGADVLVKAPQAIAVNANIAVNMAEGYELEAVRSEVMQAVEAAIRAENNVSIVRRTELIAAVRSVRGVFNFVMSLPVADVVLAGDELAIPGNIEVTVSG